MDQKTTAQIIARVLDGDRQAYALLVEEYQAAVYHLALRMTGNSEDAGDLAQETFVRAFRNLHRCDPDKKFFTWLYTIGLNVLRNHLRKRKKAAAHDETAGGHLNRTAEGSENPEQLLIRGEDAAVLNACLRKLPVDLREAVVLRFYQDLSFEDVAAISGASVSAVKMRVYRGLERLKQLMEEGSGHGRGSGLHS
ncbi:MAG: sigma-70 family RNA polymerase sigma factor [Deltaproteobacteria bacterium]|nr:sigma-70 family RNA polymerase sigma factor [Deltaproteobacteria bacterium]